MSPRLTRKGVSLRYDVYGAGARTVLLAPTWSVIDSRMWKFQVPYLARHHRVITFDGRGSGGSDRPMGAAAYAIGEFAADLIAVLDATATASATLVGLSCGALWQLLAAAGHPARVTGLACIAPATGLAPNHPEREVHPFETPVDTDAGWAKYNRYYWRRAYPEFVDFFARQCLPEPHSSRQVEDFVAWGLDTTPEVLADATRGLELETGVSWPELCADLRCPVLVIHGDADRIRPHAQGAALAAASGGRLVTLGGAGHLPQLRHPVVVNRLLDEFIAAMPPSGPGGS